MGAHAQEWILYSSHIVAELFSLGQSGWTLEYEKSKYMDVKNIVITKQYSVSGKH